MDIDTLRSWIGREESQSETLTPALAQRFNATFDLHAPTKPEAEAPLLIHLCLCAPVVAGSGLGPDGHPERGGFLPPVPLPRRMWAGGNFTFHAAPRIGDVVTRRSTIEDVTLKDGRSGRLCFVRVRHEIHGKETHFLTEQQDIVYRDEPTPAAVPAPAPPAPRAEASRTIRPDPVLLFRFSALTFNGHRIHYDRAYATGEEGYPGLVVHGPLQATLLAQYAADLRGSPPRAFSFRSLAPLFDTADVTLNASDIDAEVEGDGTTLGLWTAAPGGPVAMEARAQW